MTKKTKVQKQETKNVSWCQGPIDEIFGDYNQIDFAESFSIDTVNRSKQVQIEQTMNNARNLTSLFCAAALKNRQFVNQKRIVNVTIRRKAIANNVYDCLKQAIESNMTKKEAIAFVASKNTDTNVNSIVSKYNQFEAMNRVINKNDKTLDYARYYNLVKSDADLLAFAKQNRTKDIMTVLQSRKHKVQYNMLSTIVRFAKYFDVDFT